MIGDIDTLGKEVFQLHHAEATSGHLGVQATKKRMSGLLY